MTDHLPPNLFDRDMAELARRNPGRVWLWLALIAAIVLTGVSAWRQGWFTPVANLYVELPGASGVQVGTPVKLKGFKIGEVVELKLEDNLNVRAKLRVALVRLPLLAVDASARFGRDGPIGGKYIDISPGVHGPLTMQPDAVLPMEVGNDLDDVMATVKVAVEKLAVAIGKVEPILDDTKKLTGEASGVSTDVRTSLSTMMSNMEIISGQLKRVGDTATHLTQNADQDRANLVADVRKTLALAAQIATTANASLAAIDKELPVLLGKVQRSASDANQITGDATQLTKTAQSVAKNVEQITADAKQISQDTKQISAEAVVQVPTALRAGRTVAQDVANITEGAKRTWPVSTFVGTPPEAVLPLDGFEGAQVEKSADKK
jgi:phospholipid/cholesterol/gamma-HCH transport system substrate-binding protein